MISKRLLLPPVILLTAAAPPAALGAQVTGQVFVDRNGNGTREVGESGVARVTVSNQVEVTTTDSAGRFSLAGRGTGVVFISVPDGFRAQGSFWRAAGSTALTFAIVPLARRDELTFVHASDTHIQPSVVPRFDRLRAIVDSVGADFVLITGDLTRDALRVSEAEARGYFELYGREAGRITRPVWNVPGNHELFGIERHTSLVSPTHPLYGRGMYRHYQGPDYYSFNAGGVHFVGLNTADHDDLWYYGHVDSAQLAWLRRDLATVPPEVPVVTFNHIPFASGMPGLAGYFDDPPAPTLIQIRGKQQFRHVVSNLREVLDAIGPRPFPLALGGHNHARERLEFSVQGRAPIRFEQTGAVVGAGGPEWYPMTSGVTVYHLREGRIPEGTFIPLGLP